VSGLSNEHEAKHHRKANTRTINGRPKDPQMGLANTQSTNK